VNLQHYYKVLGFDKPVDKDTLKKQYRKLSKQYHPDNNPDDQSAHDKFKEIAEAYDMICNPHKIKSLNTRPTYNKTNIVRDIQKTVSITLEELFKDTNKTVKYSRIVLCDKCGGEGGDNPTNCSECNGTGEVVTTQRIMGLQFTTKTPCGTCNGLGHVPEILCGKCEGKGLQIKYEEITIQIPNSTNEWSKLLIPEMGNHVFRQPPGNLLIHIEIKKHPIYVRENELDISRSLDFTYSELVIGCEKEFDHLDGKKIKVTLPPGSTHESIFRLIGRGLPNEVSTGCLYTKGNLLFPDKDDKEVLDKISEIRELEKNRDKPCDEIKP